MNTAIQSLVAFFSVAVVGVACVWLVERLSGEFSILAYAAVGVAFFLSVMARVNAN